MGKSLNPMATVFVPQKHKCLKYQHIKCDCQIDVHELASNIFTQNNFFNFLLMNGYYERFLNLLKMKTLKQIINIIDVSLDFILTNEIDFVIRNNYIHIFKTFEDIMIEEEYSETLLKLLLCTEKVEHVKFLDKLLTKIKLNNIKSKTIFDILIKHFNFSKQMFEK